MMSVTNAIISHRPRRRRPNNYSAHNLSTAHCNQSQ